MFIFQNNFPVHNDFVTLNRHHFTGILIHEIFHPGLQNTRSQPTANNFFQSRFGNIYFICQIKYLQDILIRLKSDSTQQRSHRQLFLPVNVSVHHIIDVRSKFNPRAFKRNNSGRIKFGTIRMNTLSEKYTRRPM